MSRRIRITSDSETVYRIVANKSLPDFIKEKDTLTREDLLKWVAKVAAKKNPSSNNWSPALHPRDPRTGKFVERPYSVGGLSRDEISDLDTSGILELLDSEGENVNAVLQDDSISIDGVSDDVNSVSDLANEGSNDSGAIDADLSGKSEQELRDLKEFLESKHKNAREARRGQGGRSTDTQLDKKMKDTLDKIREIDRELERREQEGGGDINSDEDFAQALSNLADEYENYRLTHSPTQERTSGRVVARLEATHAMESTGLGGTASAHSMITVKSNRQGDTTYEIDAHVWNQKQSKGPTGQQRTLKNDLIDRQIGEADTKQEAYEIVEDFMEFGEETAPNYFQPA